MPVGSSHGRELRGLVVFVGDELPADADSAQRSSRREIHPADSLEPHAPLARLRTLATRNAADAAPLTSDLKEFIIF